MITKNNHIEINIVEQRAFEWFSGYIIQGNPSTLQNNCTQKELGGAQ